MTWDGLPENPERTGPHWIEDRTLDHVACVIWCHVLEQWHDMGQRMTPKGAAKFWRYLGPCLLPAEVAAREAAARREGIEAVARRFEVMTDHATAALIRAVAEVLLEDTTDG